MDILSKEENKTAIVCDNATERLLKPLLKPRAFRYLLFV